MDADKTIASGPDDKPNIIYIMLDEWGYFESCGLRIPFIVRWPKNWASTPTRSSPGAGPLEGTSPPAPP